MNTESKADLINAPTTTLLHDDCSELMKDIPNGIIDMTITDLPYGMTAPKWDEYIDMDQL